jgi:hypothetical protein
MKSIFAVTLMMALALPFGLSASAEEGGCLKYGTGGAIVGHYAGRHTMSGAAIGCGVGAWKRHQAREAERDQDRAYQQGLRDQNDPYGRTYRR